MILGSLAAVFGLLFAPVGQMFLYLALPFLAFFESVVSFFGKSNLVIHSNPLPLSVWCGYYLLLASLILLHKRKARQALVDNSFSKKGL